MLASKRFPVLLLLFLTFSAFKVYAQPNPEIANCEEITDEATQTQMDFCSAHVGCKLVIGVHSTCSGLRRFLDNLKQKVGSGTKTLFGWRKEVNAEQVFEAYRDTRLEDPDLREYKEKSLSPRWELLTSGAKAIRSSMSKDSLSKEARLFEQGNTKMVTYSDSGTDSDVREIRFMRGEDGHVTVLSTKRKSHPPYTATGPSEQINSDGTASVSGRMGGDPQGEDRLLAHMWDRALFEGVGLTTPEDLRQRGVTTFRGLLRRADGSSFDGLMEMNIKNRAIQRVNGVEYGADGAKRAEGQFRNDLLVEGKRYSGNGKVLATLTQLSDERRVAEAKAERAQAEARRLLEEEKNRERKSRQEAEAKIAKMNPGELFAHADELKFAGKHDESKNIYRTLLSKYPNHPLSTSAAQALSSQNPMRPEDGRGATNGGSGKSFSFKCGSTFSSYLNTLPNFQSRLLRDVVQSAKKDDLQVLEFLRSGRLSTEYIKQHQEISDRFNTSERQAFITYKATTAGEPDSRMCNPPDGNSAVAWAAARIGRAFHLYISNQARCATQSEPPVIIPEFCSF